MSHRSENRRSAASTPDAVPSEHHGLVSEVARTLELLERFLNVRNKSPSVLRSLVRSRRQSVRASRRSCPSSERPHQHQQPGICDPGQSFENHEWKWCFHNVHRLIVVLAHQRLRPYRMFRLYPHTSLGRAQCLCRDRLSQMARSLSAHSAGKRSWTNFDRRLRRQGERQSFKKCLAIRVEDLTDCCVHSGWDMRSRDESA
jgi:hypothetical protein